MAEIEVIQAISSIASSIGTVGVLLYWVMVERKEKMVLLGLLSEDWKRQREEEIEKRAEERYQKKISTIGSGL